MARKLASIVRISKVSPIENADRLEVAEMEGKGWRVVIQKGELKVGDLACYFEIDSFINPDDERYAFLRDRCLRKFVSKGGSILRQGLKIKTIKLRGVVSQGLLMPLDKFPEITSRIEVIDSKKYFLVDGGEIGCKGAVPVVGADVTELLKVEHYDEVKEQLQPETGSPISADAMGKFPELLGPRTDEERIQNLGDWFEKMKGRRWQITCKHDGTSCTIAYSPSVDSENPDIVCSRNLRLKRETADGKIPIYWKMAEKYDILNKLKTVYEETLGHEFMVQGEIVGPGIQKDRNKENEYMFLCFRIWDVKEQKYLNPDETVKFCETYGIPHVQVIKTDFPFFDEITTMEEALKFAEGKTKEGNEREGVVLKTVDDLPYASFKIVSNRYLMKQED